MKTAIISILFLFPTLLSGQKVNLKKDEMACALNPAKSSPDNEAFLQLVIISSQYLKDTPLVCELNDKGDSMFSKEITEIGKFFMVDMQMRKYATPHPFIIYLPVKGKKIKLAQWEYSYKDGRYKVEGQSPVVLAIPQ